MTPETLLPAETAAVAMASVSPICPDDEDEDGGGRGRSVEPLMGEWQAQPEGPDDKLPCPSFLFQPALLPGGMGQAELVGRLALVSCLPFLPSSWGGWSPKQQSPWQVQGCLTRRPKK